MELAYPLLYSIHRVPLACHGERLIDNMDIDSEENK